ncbi:MAG: diguanylate cyclase [Gammaproteobacteria bacterium]|nr:diguanylate cyclase [Gammaproteobacteria bacterium]MBU1602218.1 diguanylate cyclase [Gammaproteobacteria bacterium]MBU2434265.1 diguanylate cyclase [Gammaproteobacteria bacterium]MBU2448410.1 diguanylate cyclase [Gammaproteobacteria bacterium]
MTNKRKVLIVDASRVVRASLAKQLAERFEVRDEDNDESAWQTMVLDSAIAAVVSGLAVARDDGRGLLERLRDSKLPRLKDVPFLLMVSSSFSEAERQEARTLGVTEFIVKGSSGPSIAGIVADQMAWREDAAEGRVPAHAPEPDEVFEEYGGESDIGISNIMGQIAGLESSEGEESGEEDYRSGDTVLAEEMLEEYLAKSLPEAREGRNVGVLAFGLDGYGELVVRYGPELAFSSAQRFCFLLSRKIRPDDFIGQLADGRVVIVTRSSSALLCAGFAQRICKAMASANISVEGQRIHLTVSVGVAVAPDDGVDLSELALLDLAYERLESAGNAGGNRVVATSGRPDSGLAGCESFVPQLKELLATIDPAALRPCLGTVGMQLMPILRELDRNFHFGLPIDDMNRRLWDRARAERMMP